MPLDLHLIGTVEPSSTVAVRAQITGQLNSVGFKEGDDVKAGEVLFTLDRRPLEAALAQAEANLQRDTAQSVNAEAQAQRLVDLSARGIATREQVETSKAGAAALKGTIAADQAALENARIQLQYATIAAPLTGRTGALMVHEGNLVRANDTTPMVVINQVAPVNVAFAVPEAQLPALKGYMARGPVRINVRPPSDAREAAEGRITFVDNAVDQTTGTIRVKGSFANLDHRLWPGEFVNVIVTLSTDLDAIVVPTAAVQAGQNGAYVFVVKSDQTVEMRNIRVGRTAGEDTIVASGVNADEVVVTDGHLRLVPGSRISVRNGAQQATQ
jgi:multidrug efflux system membrane fusion protein